MKYPKLKKCLLKKFYLKYIYISMQNNINPEPTIRPGQCECCRPVSNCCPPISYWTPISSKSENNTIAFNNNISNSNEYHTYISKKSELIKNHQELYWKNNYLCK